MSTVAGPSGPASLALAPKGAGLFWSLAWVLVTAGLAAGEPHKSNLSTEVVGGPGGYASWITQVASPVNERWMVWAGYQFVWEASGASNTPSVMVGGQYQDQELEEAGGAALIFRRGPDMSSSFSLALHGGLKFQRLVPSVEVPTWVEVQLAVTSFNSMTASSTMATNVGGRLRRLGANAASSLLQTAVGLDLKHPLSPTDTLHGMVTWYVYDDSLNRLSQLPGFGLPESGVTVPSLPVTQWAVGSSHGLFEQWEFGWEYRRTNDYLEPAPIDAVSLRGAWEIDADLTLKMNWTRVTQGAGEGVYLGWGAAVRF